MTTLETKAHAAEDPSAQFPAATVAVRPFVVGSQLSAPPRRNAMTPRSFSSYALVYGLSGVGLALLGLFWAGNIGAGVGAAVGLFAASRF